MHTVDSFRVTSSRVFFLACIQSFLLLLLCIPLLRLQLFHGDRYATMAESNHIVVRIKEACRGKIFDRHGIALATNEAGFRLLLAPRNTKDLAVCLKRLKPLVHLEKADKRRLKRRLRHVKSHLTPLLIKENLSWDEVSRVSLHSNDLEGVYIEPCFMRKYPLGADAVHMLGYTAPPSEKEEVRYNLARTPYMQVGKQGLERLFEKKLRGLEGADVLELNAKRQILRTRTQARPRKGQDVHISLDSRLQTFVAKALRAYRSASVVVLNAENGEVLALVSHPSFDPHNFRVGVPEKIWKDLRENPYNPLMNKALKGLYAPGSTTKPAVILAALKHGCVTTQTSLLCKGVKVIARHPFHCWMHRWGGHGLVSTGDALVRSCDVFIYEMSKRLGRDKLKSIYQELGLGGSTRLNALQEVRWGLVPDAQWKRRVRKKGWTPGDTVQMSIGQGLMLANPLELAVMAARLATGKKVMPTYQKCAERPVFPDLDVAEEHLKFVQNRLFDAVNTPRGTVYRSRVLKSAWRIAGKTGTSQVKRISLKERTQGIKKQQERAWSDRDHALYIAFSQKSKHQPQYAIAVVIEHGGWGASSAAPVGKAVLEEVQRLGDAIH